MSYYVQHPFYGLFSRTAWVSRYPKGKTILDFNGVEWHQLDHMQNICTLLQTDEYTSTSSLNFYRSECADALSAAQPSVPKH